MNNSLLDKKTSQDELDNLFDEFKTFTPSIVKGSIISESLVKTRVAKHIRLDCKDEQAQTFNFKDLAFINPNFKFKKNQKFTVLTEYGLIKGYCNRFSGETGYFPPETIKTWPKELPLAKAQKKEQANIIKPEIKFLALFLDDDNQQF